MIQLLKLRSFIRDEKEVRYDQFVQEGLHAESLPELFENLHKYLEKIPESERWNCFYTLANCSEKKREFQSLSVMYFDVDGIDCHELEKYIELVCRTLSVSRAETGIVASGNGLHFLIGLSTPIVDKDFFKKTRDHYKALCQAINSALARESLAGHADPSVFDPRRILRLPGTINRKPGKPEKECTLINSVITPTAFDITLASGIPQVRKDEQVDPDYFRKFPKVDNAAIFKGCAFLKNAKENPVALDEPELYAALSIIGRMDRGPEVAEETFRARFGKRSHGGSAEDLALKLEQAVNASGPRMCKSIAQIYRGCATCPHYKKASSPILIKDENALPTEHTGFHDVVFDEETQKMKRGKPNFHDLRAFFERKHFYQSHDKIIWIWTGTHYAEISNEAVKSFAQDHFNPYANASMRGEFLDLVQVTNLVVQREWNEGTVGRINLQNGVLDLDKMELVPHSKSFGFKHVLPYAYDPLARAPLFEKFLDEVCVGREQLIHTLLEFGGYALSGIACRYQKALVLEGEGNNGKSTFINMLKALAGTGSYSTLSFKELDNPERRSALDGVLFNITEETPSRMHDTSSFKNLASGGDVQVRRLYKNAYSIRNKAKLMFSCNQMPTTADASKGFFRRFLIIPFDYKLSRSSGNLDTNLEAKLLAELPGILNLFLDGYKRLIKNDGFSKLEEDDEELEEYKEAIDPIRRWVEDRLIILPSSDNHYTTATDLYGSFKDWCERNGFDPRVRNAASLSIQLKHYIPDLKKRRWLAWEGDRKVRKLQGISLQEGQF